MTVDKPVIFVGPTLPKKEIERSLSAYICKPAAQGDILETYVRFKPTCIAIIDGYYENTPSVWHKEILYVLSQGVHVYGAASMGAIRASELDTFGMKGVGRIYEMYSSGQIEDDDEVAVLHGPEDLGYPPITDAMVSVRISLKAAAECGVISHDIAEKAIIFLKGIFYKQRKREVLFEYLSSVMKGAEFSVFADWIKVHYIDQKRTDAQQLIKILAESSQSHRIPNPTYFSFYSTSFFKQMMADANKEI